jgi:hypothetical protein
MTTPHPASQGAMECALTIHERAQKFHHGTARGTSPLREVADITEMVGISAASIDALLATAVAAARAEERERIEDLVVSVKTTSTAGVWVRNHILDRIRAIPPASPPERKES